MKSFNKSLKAMLDAPLRVSKIIMNKDDFDDILKWAGEPKCNICNEYFPDIQEHCIEMNDDDHLILSVHSL